ncbi:MAG: hypothetical protein AAF937_11500 [Planctomycetota bacterium]
MTRCKILMVASGAVMLAGATTANADVLEIRADLSRSIEFIDPGSPEAAAGFQVGEGVTMGFTFSSMVTDSSADPARGVYDDPSATYRLIGNTSGAVLDYAPGLRIFLVNDESVRIGSLVNPSDALNTPVLSRPGVWEKIPSNVIFSDVNDLTQVFADLFATTFDAPRNFEAETSYWDGSSPVLGMKMFGPPVGASFSLIPSPSTVALLGLAGLVGVRRRR